MFEVARGPGACRGIPLTPPRRGSEKGTGGAVHVCGGGSGGGGGTSDGDDGGSGGGEGDGDSGSGGCGGGGQRLTYTRVLELARKVKQHFPAPPPRRPIMVLVLLPSWSLLHALPPAVAAFRLVFLGKCHQDALPLPTSLMATG